MKTELGWLVVSWFSSVTWTRGTDTHPGRNGTNVNAAQT
eukprot:CAMPEP_0180654602 /NCGR_PEP_ID=MMETSP1037_2-20121125/54796_1 /TAXON_ID=632150 /ORGANISM="Azadinium spinosum, Strain 3D9" /LENGTH=38 /DNA_ID= /DNA_START= /DNA_END= /DNA_ORIENTATION=